MSLAFDRVGEGAPAFVFVHGFGCAREDWAAQAAHFKGAHTCLSLDLPGFGGSPPLPDRPSMQAFSFAIARTLTDEDIGRSVLCGHSMGCRPIIEYAIARPECVDGLVLIDPGRASTDYEPSKRQFEALIAKRGFPNHARSMFANMFFDPTYNKLRDRLAERVTAVPSDVATSTYLAMLDWDANRCENAFDDVTVPVLVIQSTTRNPGEDRRPLRPGEMSPYQKMIVERIDGAESESFPGLGHFTMIEAAGDVNARIAQFVEERVTS